MRYVIALAIFTFATYSAGAQGKEIAAYRTLMNGAGLNNSEAGPGQQGPAVWGNAANRFFCSPGAQARVLFLYGIPQEVTPTPGGTIAPGTVLSLNYLNEADPQHPCSGIVAMEKAPPGNSHTPCHDSNTWEVQYTQGSYTYQWCDHDPVNTNAHLKVLYHNFPAAEGDMACSKVPAAIKAPSGPLCTSGDS